MFLKRYFPESKFFFSTEAIEKEPTGATGSLTASLCSINIPHHRRIGEDTVYGSSQDP